MATRLAAAADRHVILREIATTTSAPPLALLNVTAGSILITLEAVHNSTWLGQWQDTGLYLTVYGFVISGTLASVGGVMAYRDFWVHRRDVLSGVSKTNLAVCLLAIIPVVAWLWAGHLVVTGLAVVRTYWLNPDMMEITPLVALALASILFHTCIGFGIAAIFSGKLLSLPLAAMVPYSLYFASDALQLANLGSWSQLFGFYIGPGWSPANVAARWPLAHLVTYILATSLALLLIVAWARSRDSGNASSAPGLAFAIAGVMLVGGLSLVGTWRSDGLSRPDSRALVCDLEVDNVTVCLWPSQAWQRNVWSEGLSFFVGSAKDLDLDPITVLPAGTNPTGSGQVVVALGDNPTANEIYWGIVSRVVRHQAVRCGNDSARSADEVLMEDVLLRYFTDPGGDRRDEAVRLLATC